MTLTFIAETIVSQAEAQVKVTLQGQGETYVAELLDRSVVVVVVVVSRRESVVMGCCRWS